MQVEQKQITTVMYEITCPCGEKKLFRKVPDYEWFCSSCIEKRDAKIYALREEGKTFKEISKICGKSTSYVALLYHAYERKLFWRRKEQEKLSTVTGWIDGEKGATK